MYQEKFNSTLVYAKTLEVKTIRLILLRVFLDWKSISSPAYRIQKVPCTCYFYVEFFVIFCAFDYCLFLVEMAGARTLMPARKRRVACLSVRRLVESVCVCLYFYGCQRQAPSVRGRGIQQAGRGRCPAVRYRRTSLLFVCLPAGITDRRSIQARKTTRRSSSPRRFALYQLFQQRHTELSRLTSTGSY